MVDGVRGIRVLDGEEANKYLEIINIFHNVAQKYDCTFIKIPTIEKDELFTRTVGENTDIVTKQMFSFPDKKGRNLVLRPEGTAGVVRHHIDKKYNKIKKYYYSDQMFRYERPQKGRYREFHQVGAEIIGYENNSISEIFSIIQLSNDFLENCIPTNTKYTFEIVPENSKGSQDALGGGGQYDNLSKLLGGKDINGVGVAFGVDRIMELS